MQLNNIHACCYVRSAYCNILECWNK